MSECPYCKRRLLSQASPTCNWCGREIADAAYQERAAVARDRFFIEQALHDAASLAAVETMNVGNPWMSPVDPFTGLPYGRAVPPPIIVMTAPPTPAPTPAPTPDSSENAEEETPGARFRHLEL